MWSLRPANDEREDGGENLAAIRLTMANENPAVPQQKRVGTEQHQVRHSYSNSLNEAALVPELQCFAKCVGVGLHGLLLPNKGVHGPHIRQVLHLSPSAHSSQEKPLCPTISMHKFRQNQTQSPHSHQLRISIPEATLHPSFCPSR